MEVVAKANYLRISPRKAALVMALVRGLPVAEARKRLAFSGKKAGRLVGKLLDSAVANAQNNFNLKEEDLYVAEAVVSRGPQLKRVRFVSRGRAHRVVKHTSHLTLVLKEKVSGEGLALTAGEESGRKRPAAAPGRKRETMSSGEVKGSKGKE